MFYNGLLKGGNEPVNKPNGGNEIGHIGNGYIRITALEITHKSIIRSHFFLVLIPTFSTFILNKNNNFLL